MTRMVVALAVSAMAIVARADVPDASLRAMKDRAVRLELDGAPAIEGTLIAFEAGTVTLARSGTHEVTTVERARLVRLIAIEGVEPAKPLPPEKFRVVGLSFGIPGTLVVDADYKIWRAFASANVLFPALTASGDGTWFGGALGGGLTLPMGSTTRWKLDLFAHVMPLHITSYYTNLAFGVGAGFHYTSRRGFTVGFTLPLFGAATRFGNSPYGYDAPFRYNDSTGYYYLASFAGLPLVTMGYRFATNCPLP